MSNSVMDNTASEASQIPVENVVKEAAERLFKQSELNEIVGRAKHEAVESYKRQNQVRESQPQNQSYSSSNSRALSEDDVRKLTSEELARQRDEWEKQSLERQYTESAKRIVNAYNDKISNGKEKYQDFDSVTGSLDMRYYPNVVQLLAEHVDNASDVLYELAKNRTKLSQLDYVFERNPRDAIYEVQRLSESIKANEESAKLRDSKQPLSQQRPSNTGTDSGALSMRDLKRKYRG